MISQEPNPSILTDEPRWSSASLCVTLNHLGNRFRPEYTHQLVGGECWRGQRPLASVLQTARADYEKSLNPGKESSAAAAAAAAATTVASTIKTSASILHKSHGNHRVATNELDIAVRIAPSCQACSVDITRTEIDRSVSVGISIGDKEPVAKRQKTEPNSESRSSQGTESSSPKISMTDSEIMEALSKALPPIASQSDEREVDVDELFLSKPIGDVVEEYSCSTQTEDGPPAFADFVLTIADGRLPGVSEYHNSVQKLALFYIENADTVDVGKDDDGGFWKIVYVFGKHPHPLRPFRYSLVGYYTLFHFNAMFHKPKPGWILRICQALVLPPFQGQGHGKRLLRAVYDMAHRTKEENDDHQAIIQINVEDPAPVFVALRNNMDWNGSMTRENGTSKSLAPTDELTAFFSAMTEKEASEMSVKAKIIPKQIHLTNELLKLRAVRCFLEEESEKGVSEEDRETIDRCFRLMVKRRLNKEHREELLEQPSKDDQKAMLARLFEEELKGYERILSKLAA
eukprot:jgi/Psemu1/211698/e_gw1.575.46.1